MQTVAQHLRQEGMQLGRQQGIEEGVQQGMQAGFSTAQYKIVQNMMKQGLDDEFIALVTGLSESEVKKLRKVL